MDFVELNGFHLIADGKFKKIYQTGEVGIFKMSFFCENVKESILRSKISAKLFSLLKFCGIKTHFIESISVKEHKVLALDIFPLKFHVFLYVNEELAKQFNLEVGTKLSKPILNIFLKYNNQLISKDQLLDFNCLVESDLIFIQNAISKITDAFLAYFFAFDLMLFDFCLEFGRKYKNNGSEYEICLADELNISTMNMVSYMHEKITNEALAKAIEVI